MTTKRATLLAKVLSSSSSSSSSSFSINNSFDSIKTLTLSKNFSSTATTPVSSNFTINPSSNGYYSFDYNSSGYGKHPSSLNGDQNGVELNPIERVSPQNDEFQYNTGAQNGNFGGYYMQSHVVLPQQRQTGSYHDGSYGRSVAGYQGIVNGNYSSNVGQFRQIVGDSYTGNVGMSQLNTSAYQIPNGFTYNDIGQSNDFGRYDTQNYDGSPQQNQNGLESGSYGRSHVGYQGTVNGNYHPNMGQLHQTVGNGYTGDVGMNHLNTSSNQIPFSGFSYNNVGQKGITGGYDRHNYAVLPQQSPNALYNGSYGRSDAGYQGNTNENYNPVGQFHQIVADSSTGNFGMDQQNSYPYQIPDGGFTDNSVGHAQPHQNRNDQRSENAGVQTQNSYYRNNDQNIQQNQFGNLNRNNLQQIQQNLNDYSGYSGGYRRTNGYKQSCVDQLSLTNEVNRFLKSIQHHQIDDNNAVGNVQPWANDDNVGYNTDIASKYNIRGKFNQNASMEYPVPKGDTFEAFRGNQYKGTVDEFDEFCKEGKVKEAMEVLELLQKQQINIDMPQYLCLVKACGEAKALREAKATHKLITESISPLEVSTYNKILEMYSKCGSMIHAYRVFHSMPDHNLTSWNILITWLAKNKLPNDAINMFKQFKKSNIKPDGETFIGIFSACGALGKSEEGVLYFEEMINEYDIVPTMKHYASVVDMLCNAGSIDDALEFIDKMPIEPGEEIYETLMKQFSAPENSLHKGGFANITGRNPRRILSPATAWV